MARAIPTDKATDKTPRKLSPKRAAKPTVATTSPTPTSNKTKAAAPDATFTLKAAMTGKASPAKTAEGDEPVFAYFRSLPQPRRGIAERVDALAGETLPTLQRAVKWGIAWYGVGDGWCFSCGGFVGHVKLTFGRGTSLEPVPPITPIGMGKDSRGVDLTKLRDLDEVQIASWMKQATAIPGFGQKRRSPGLFTLLLARRASSRSSACFRRSSLGT